MPADSDSGRAESGSPAPVADTEPRLPRPPGVFRRFWARHPVISDAVLTGVVLLLSLLPGGATRLDPALDPAHVQARLAATVVASCLVVLSCGAIMLRRRWPYLLFALALAAEAMFLVGTHGGAATPALVVAAYTVATLRGTRAAWAAFGTASGVLVLVAGLATLTGWIPFRDAANPVLGSVLLSLIGTLIGINIGNRRRYLQALIDRSERLLVERDQRAQLAAAEERTRIARELHDIVSHSLTVIVALSEGANATADRQRARDATAQVATTARGALNEMRSMLGVLRGTDDVPLAPDAADAVDHAVAAAQRAGFPVTLTVSGAADPPAAVRLAIARIAQEGLTNAMRHARARQIRVAIRYRPDAVDIEVVNDGVSAEPVGDAGYGLRGLRERVAHVGGTLSAGTDPHGRWVVRARLPLAPVATGRPMVAGTDAPADPRTPTAPDAPAGPDAHDLPDTAEEPL